MKASSVSQTLVEPYAEALMSLAKDRSLVEPFGNDVQQILETLRSSNELRQLLEVPLIKNNVKKSVIAEVFGSRIHPFLQSFLMVLVDRRRITFLEPICLQFQALLREMNQVAFAEIISAVALTEAQQATLEQKVLDVTSARSVQLSIVVNPDLIGGVIIKIGSQVIDASIRGQLRRLSSSLMAGV
ncbi:ATP synthase F1 subunit delta [Tumidithrix helvetica PCC 7403]|uniref:ATP synthase F1 subunit delta n=1 Tax=Tumidithrix helvetica TaxID=3457545 RepID=UPI003C8B5ED5